MVDYIIEHWTKIRCRRLKPLEVILMLLSSCRRPLWRKLHGGSTTLKGKPDVFHTARLLHFSPQMLQERDGGGIFRVGR